MKRSILILHCGGTIGMGPTQRGFAPLDNFGERLQTRLAAAGDSLPEVHYCELEPLIDSANAQPHDWQRMAAVLRSQWQNYDGFLLLHGTDSMAFSASALSFLLGPIDKPVLLTGAQIPLVEPHSDATDNLLGSLKILAQPSALAEVCVYFHQRLLRGNRSVKFRSTGPDAFDSPNLPPLGRTGARFELHHELLLPPAAPDFRPCTIDDDAVAVLGFYPGVSERLFSAVLSQAGLRALVIRAYGVGNGPDRNTALMRELRRASDDGICVLTITRCAQGSVLPPTYATGTSLAESGVIGGRDLTLEAAYSKLHVLIGQGLSATELREQMPEPLRGECSA
ncbi:asparaginase domain-containing protein [Granulosicoccaceae sp. 1_MG-2023]|nr:asparaginase domain-containing protein [Granulosicoccaceae sp. 1_MG-2023]